MSAAEIRTHLCDLQLERLEAESTGLSSNRSYMADLASEQAEYQQALVAGALEEVLTLRSELSRRQYGWAGIKGIGEIGEIGVVGVSAAIANAVYHATGQRIRSLPITVEQLL